MVIKKPYDNRAFIQCYFIKITGLLPVVLFHCHQLIFRVILLQPAEGGLRGIFFRADKVNFPDFFSGPWNMFFFFFFFLQVEIFHFSTPQTNFSGFKKWKAKKKKKVFSYFSSSIYNFPSFTIFLLSSPFPFFLASIFPVGLRKFPSQKRQGATLPPCPHLLCHCQTGSSE